MKIYFLRHGIAADRDEWQGKDFDRPLTDEGRKRLLREAKTFAQLGIDPDAIVTSPLVRAKQTAQVVAEEMHLGAKVAEDDRLGPGFDAQRLAGVLRERGRNGAVMLVGHEPDMSTTIGEIIGGAQLDLKKGGLALVELPETSSLRGTLEWLLPPKLLALR